MDLSSSFWNIFISFFFFLTSSPFSLSFPPSFSLSCFSLSGERLAFFPDLRDWIESFLQSETKLVSSPSRKNHNDFIAAVLNLVFDLVFFGYYNMKNDLVKLLAALYQVMEGGSDYPTEVIEDFSGDRETEWKEKNRFEKNPENLQLFEIKLVGLRILDAVINFRTLTLLKQFLFDIKGLVSLETSKGISYPLTLPWFFGINS